MAPATMSDWRTAKTFVNQTPAAVGDSGARSIVLGDPPIIPLTDLSARS